MKALLLVSSFNSLTLPAWCRLRAGGHNVAVEFALDEPTMIAAAHLTRDRARVWYLRHDRHVGELVFTPYNGALDVAWSRRLASALRKALAQDTRVLVLRAGFDTWCNGIDLNAIKASDEPAMTAWASIRAINAVCRLIAQHTGQVIVADVSGDAGAGAGAGGVMMLLGADLVAARDGVILNSFYADMGLYGSELHTRTLPRRKGTDTARRLLTERLPIDADQAAGIGRVDEVGPRSEEDYRDWLLDQAHERARDRRWKQFVRGKREAAAAELRPLAYWEQLELAEMARDMSNDRQQFDQRRRSFVQKQRPGRTPAQLATHRVAR